MVENKIRQMTSGKVTAVKIKKRVFQWENTFSERKYLEENRNEQKVKQNRSD